MLIKLKNLLKKKRLKHGIIFCHHNADPDAIYSAHVLLKLLKKISPKTRCEIFPVQGPSRLSKLLMEKVPVRVVVKPKLWKADFFILVDTSTLKQLDEWGLKIAKLKKPIIVVDHHTIHPKTRKIASLLIVDTNASSTCEIVYRLCCKAKLRLTRRDALGLLFGIIFETKGFRYASAETLRTSANLLEYGITVDEALRFMAKPVEKSEKIARLKAASRLQLHRFDGWLVVLSHVSSYQASVARALIGLGGDVVAVAGGKKGEVRVSLRATQEFYDKTGVHLGRDVAFVLGERFGGMGGGHATSAGVNGFGSVEEVLAETLKILREKILGG
ncbi:MAG: hypothetical protein DRO36_03800 [Candidatus Hecatellales archaeon]|nr:MAG: hypothetical protein DRO36_03800 [Candidatus Hecatellales archaeon]